jgi:hypothetical protein
MVPGNSSSEGGTGKEKLWGTSYHHLGEDNIVLTEWGFSDLRTQVMGLDIDMLDCDKEEKR